MSEEKKSEKRNLVPRWYIVQTYSGYENKVEQTIRTVVQNRGLHDLIFETKIPTECVTEIVNGKAKEVEHKIYPGYVFVKMIHTDDSWHVVRSTRGVTGFVGPGSEPQALTDKEAEKMGLNSDISASSVRVNYKVGDRVQIVGTNLNGLVGAVQSIDLELGKVELLVDMFGRETPITAQLDQVVLVD